MDKALEKKLNDQMSSLHFDNYQRFIYRSGFKFALELLKEPTKNAPDWWDEYKRVNPHDHSQYDPKKHCCKKFYKDFCECTKSKS